jgi:hypothetical protein
MIGEAKQRSQMVSQRMGDQNLLTPAPSCFGRQVKPLDPVAFADVSATPVSRKLTTGRRPIVKICRIFITI